MTLSIEDINWQTKKLGNVDIVTANQKVFAYNETHHLRSGFRLVRKCLQTSVPIFFPAYETNDYIGVCFTFGAENIAKKDLAYSHLYHNDLNITNGYQYESKTLNALNQPFYYVSLQFSSDFLQQLCEQQPLPSWLAQLALSNNNKIVDRISVPANLRQLAWQLCCLPNIRQLSDAIRIEAKALEWLAGLLEISVQEDPLSQSFSESLPKSLPQQEHKRQTSQSKSGYSSPHQQLNWHPSDKYQPNNVDTPNTFRNSTKNIAKFVEQARQIIHSEYAQPLTIIELAQRVGTNECYLKQYFKAHTGHSVHDYLTHYRLSQAQAMLRHRPEMSIKHIAELCGYQPTHFSQIFRYAFGVTPSQYRQKCLKL